MRAVVLTAVVLLCIWELPERISPTRGVDSRAFAPPPDLAEFGATYATTFAVGIVAICVALARSEKALAPPPQVPIEKRPDYNTVLWMSALLSFASGVVNALAILDMAMTVAHHTGNASHTGRLLGESAMKFFTLMVAYAVGAGIVGFSKSDGEAVYSGRYSPGLLAAAIAVAGGSMVRWFGTSESSSYTDGRAMVTLALWSLSQGMQNAISRKCSSMPVCTTHMTGYLTDFGSTLGAIVRASSTNEAGPSPLKPGFFGLSIFTFAAGGYAAKVMLPSYGAQAALLPAAIMTVVALGLVPIPNVQKGK